ncbi:MAG: hypothetical protein MJZ25_03990 [Fibrobacter sp.]|nr:hypothetical protein [Fibrobacter sp.]
MADNIPPMIELFPAEEFGRMLMNIDRFDMENPKPDKVNVDKLADLVDEVSEHIIEDNL